MKNKQNIAGFIALLLVISTFFFGCSKDAFQDGSSKEKKVVLSEFDLSFVPEGDLAELMQAFFDGVNDYMGDSNAISHEYSISEGIWYLLTGINYTSANLLAQISEIEEYTFTHEIELAEDIPAGLSATGVISAFLGFHEDLQSLEESGYDVGLVRFDTITSGESGILLTLRALRGRVVEYPDVEPESSPAPLPSGPNLKMGVPFNGYKSAAHETEDRYNPYLWKSKIDDLDFEHGYFLVTPLSPISFYGWTHSTNCFFTWPPGDYILNVSCPTPPASNNPTHLHSQVTVSTFNTYLERFFQAKISAFMSDNINFEPAKWLFTTCGIHYLPDCWTCGHAHNQWKKSSLAFFLYRGNVHLIIEPINTYTL